MNESGLDKKATLHEQKSSEVLTYQHKYTVLKFKQNVSFRANKIIAQKFEFSIPHIFLYLSQIFEFLSQKYFFTMLKKLGFYTKILKKIGNLHKNIRDDFF